MINNINYLNEDIIKDELELIFHKSWFFVGLLDKLQFKNDYITYRCGSVSIVVQNSGDELKCFSNICLHRFNSIFEGTEGNKRSICSYHNWLYNDKGMPMVKTGFYEDLSALCRPRLAQYQVETCGKFVFVKVNNELNQSLESFLGEFYNKLVKVSSFFSQISNEKPILIDHKANWKLLVENVLECYHCNSVHKETLVPMGIGGQKPENHFHENGHDMVDYPMNFSPMIKERAHKLQFVTKSQYFHNSLQHWYVFPNLFITSSAGNLFYIGKLIPIHSGCTRLQAEFVKPTYTELSKREEILLKAHAQVAVESSIKVINEDKIILEEIQKNMRKVENQKQIFGDEEFRIKYFHQKISKLINYK